MGRGKFKGKPTGHRHFSTPEELRTYSASFPFLRRSRSGGGRRRV
ncbi:hypothetical protein Goari_010403 [Gossypium aridum]|uniref:Uncharacterized protein n=1 Tax=Gossypium aridum TaxID=34290 RepID=A0A7J8XZX2_GOSAI|nr:hypothetical protein [Gossypium aridum]